MSTLATRGRAARVPVGTTSRAVWVGRVVAAVVGSAVVGSLLWYVGVLPHGYPASLMLSLGFGLVVFLVVWTAQEHGPHLEAAAWFTSRREEAAPPTSLDYRMLRLRRDLRDALERNDRTDDIYALVRELAAERLSAHHDLDLSTQPEEAVRVLTADLTAYLNRPPRGTERRSRRQLERAIDGIEEL
jgi:hypothetical protein